MIANALRHARFSIFYSDYRCCYDEHFLVTGAQKIGIGVLARDEVSKLEIITRKRLARERFFACDVKYCDDDDGGEEEEKRKQLKRHTFFGIVISVWCSPGDAASVACGHQ
jgi:hypothetical protein